MARKRVLEKRKEKWEPCLERSTSSKAKRRSRTRAIHEEVTNRQGINKKRKKKAKGRGEERNKKRTCGRNAREGVL